ncbi:LacI family DNA-binding transcriptional regulator [Rubrobacter calidifluminis]|uniref:LacI family DNA-binding transcriptional regulator n=1 Tax=Rubrobacter calidifluminis TaxID=1392640 RepID=UPI00235E7761|nr:LacI family DNA-binding transcriptional regulator [Rubrobacter calidifluminis]
MEREPFRNPGRVTLRDVAQEAGVSIKTVSRVINGEREVNPETAARVSEVAAKLGYRPNELARSLKGRRTRTIGLMIADISNPFYAALARAVEEVARSRGYTMILCASSEDPEIEREYVEVLSGRRVDGLLFVPAPGDGSHLRREQEAGLPMVAIDRPAEGIRTDTVMVQNAAGTRKAVEHLISHGHRHIAFIGDDKRLHTTRKRLQGYLEATRATGLRECFRLGCSTTSAAEEAMLELLEAPDHPTAIFAGNNLISTGVLEAIARAGLRIPYDIAFAGFDDFPLASALRPRLTLVRQPVDELGRKAAELLFDRLEGEKSSSPSRIILPTRLIVRESCGCAPS